MRDLVYHTQLGRYAIDASKQRELEQEARAIALRAMPRVIYRQREVALTSEDNDESLNAAKFLASIALPKLESVTVSGPDGAPIQVEHDHSSIVRELAAMRDEILGAAAPKVVEALPPVAVDRSP